MPTIAFSWNQLGETIYGGAAGDQSGFSVSLSSDGKIVAIGACQHDGNGSNAGHVRVYEYNDDTLNWHQLGGDIDGEVEFDQSGFSVSLYANGKIVAIGTIENDGNCSGAGHVRVYGYDANCSNWI